MSVSIIHQWHKLRRELAYLAECPDKGKEIGRLLEVAQEYMQHHGNRMFFLGMVVGISLLATVLLVWRIYAQG